MCSVDTCNDLVIEKKLNLSGASCRKCDSVEAKVVLQGKFPYCRECFFIYFKHKYSSGIGKTKIVRPRDKILIAFSGSFSSICLLDLIYSSLLEDRKKKTIFEVVLVFISEEYERSFEERHNVFKCLVNMVSAYNYKLYFSSLTTVDKDVILSEDPQALFTENYTDIKYILQGFTSKSARKDFVEILSFRFNESEFVVSQICQVVTALYLDDRFYSVKNVMESSKAASLALSCLEWNLYCFSPASFTWEELYYFVIYFRTHVLYEVAKKLQCTKIFTAETSDHIAGRIIGNIAMGRGKMLSTDIGFISNLDEKIPLVRPLRECSKKEIVFYNVFKKLHHHFFHWVLEEDKFSSIQKLTESFISELQQSFPSTVTTITSTGSKIGVGEGTDGRCLLCQSYLNKTKDFTAEEAMQISKLVTTYGPNNFDSSNFSSTEDDSERDTYLPQKLPVCYSCSILIKESKNKEDLLKPFVHNLEEVNRQQMYNDIKDFLI